MYVFHKSFVSSGLRRRKSTTPANFKDFVKKNEKGYFKPFLSMSYGILISLANAFAFSLNSFVTLGFGNIPLKESHGTCAFFKGFSDGFC